MTQDFTEHERSIRIVVLVFWPVTNCNGEELCTHKAERLTRLLVRINPKLLDHNSAMQLSIVEHCKFNFWSDQQFPSAVMVWKGCTLSQTPNIEHESLCFDIRMNLYSNTQWPCCLLPRLAQSRMSSKIHCSQILFSAFLTYDQMTLYMRLLLHADEP